MVTGTVGGGAEGAVVWVSIGAAASEVTAWAVAAAVAASRGRGLLLLLR